MQIGILTKEVAATIPLMVLAAELILLNRNYLNPKKFQPWQLYLLITILGILFYFLFIKIVRTNFLDVYFHFSALSSSHEGDVITGGRYFLTQMRVFLTFLRLLILPINQNLDYDYPLSSGLFNPPLTFVGLCLIGFIAFLILKLRKQRLRFCAREPRPSIRPSLSLKFCVAGCRRSIWGRLASRFCAVRSTPRLSQSRPASLPWKFCVRDKPPYRSVKWRWRFCAAMVRRRRQQPSSHLFGLSHRTDP